MFNWEIHPYKNGYSVLPKLLPLNGSPFNSCSFNNFPVSNAKFAEQKKLAVERQKCYVEHDLDPICEDAICEYIRAKNKISGSFQELAMQLNEDIVIHCLDEKRDWMAAGHVCFPSGWLPEEKVGKSFLEIHSDIPGMRLDNSRKLVEAMIHSSPYERYVWGVYFEERINGHPSLPRKRFDIHDPQVFIRWERQVIIGFPAHSAALFVIGQNLISESQIDVLPLMTALHRMTIEQRIYKGINEDFDDLMRYLHTKLTHPAILAWEALQRQEIVV